MGPRPCVCVCVCVRVCQPVVSNPSALCRKLFGGRLAHLRVALYLWGWHCTSGWWRRTPSVGGLQTYGALHMRAMNMKMMVMVMVMMSICGVQLAVVALWGGRRCLCVCFHWLCRSMLLAGNCYRKLVGACSHRDRRNATHTRKPCALIKSPHMRKHWRFLRQFSGMIESSILDVRRQNGLLAEQLAWSSQQAQAQAPIAKPGKGFLPFVGPTLATDTGW